MWLLDTHTIELRLFHHPPTTASKDARPYAILSHVWNEDGEQSFQELKAIIDSVTQLKIASFHLLKDERITAKIRKCCVFARAMGYQLLWIDTCCIDKTSSAELSEAINSMFEWYSCASVCYAYLHDVDDDQDPTALPVAPGKNFRGSTWFTRGWTLQELIAPRDVLFLSKNWNVLGTKEDLADVIEEITGVDRAVLLFEAPLGSISVARRMSWASNRTTRRVEDEAYSLLGLFGIYMPTIYGEGRNAFLRLQEEILKHIPDQSIFVWTTMETTFVTERDWSDYSSESQAHDYQGGFGLSRSYADVHGRLYCGNTGEHSQRYLLARRPSYFRNSARISHIPFSSLAEKLKSPVGTPHYTLTSYGVQMRLPTIPGKDWVEGNHLAILACQDSDGRLAALILNKTEDDRERCYVVGFQYAINNTQNRVVFLYPPQHTPITITDIYIAYGPAYLGLTRGFKGLSETREGWFEARTFCGPCTIFVPQWILLQLDKAGHHVHNLPSPSDGRGGRSFTLVWWSLRSSRRNIVITTSNAHVSITISIALCASSSRSGVWRYADDDRYPLHVAVTSREGDTDQSPCGQELPMDCATEHVAKPGWTDGARTWEIPALGAVTLRLKNWPCGKLTESSRPTALSVLALEVQIVRATEDASGMGAVTGGVSGAPGGPPAAAMCGLDLSCSIL